MNHTATHLFALIILAVLLPACGSESDSTDEPVEVVLISTDPSDQAAPDDQSDQEPPAEDPESADPASPNDETSVEDEPTNDENDGSDDVSSGDTDEGVEEEEAADNDVPFLSECSDDRDFFNTELWTTVLAPRCAGCHQSGSLAEDSRMVFNVSNTQSATRENFNAAWIMAMYLESGESLLLRKPSGRSNQPHGGGALLSESSVEYQRLEHWVQRALDIAPCSDFSDSDGSQAETNPGDEQDDDSVTPAPPSLPDLADLPPGRRMLRRLSHAEYDASIQVVLGQSTDAAATLATDNVVNGYTNNADALVVSPLLASQYAELAEELGLRVAYQDSSYQACVALESAATCFRDLLLTLGKKLFRRPLTNEELNRYFNLWYDIALEDGEIEATRWAFTAILQSPHFLYRAELGSQSGDSYQLSHYEIASQLAFNLTGLPPDQDLMLAADEGNLRNNDALSSHVSRLVQSDAGQSHFGNFLAAWLGLDNIETVARNTSLYPEFTAGIRTDMLRQTLKTGATWLERDAQFAELFTSPLSFVTDELAAFYTMASPTAPADNHGLREVRLPETYPAGLLSHGAVLATYAKASASSPIHRGVLVRERVLCQELAPPPPNLDTSPPAVDPTQSTRERYIEHASNPACSSCHDLIDPIGFGFEHYDAVGRWREADGVHTIDASGAILFTPNSDGQFDGLAELGQHLASSQDVEDCFIQQWSEYLYGLHHDEALDPSVVALQEHFAQSDKNLQATLARFIELPHITSRAHEDGIELPDYANSQLPLTLEDLLNGRPDFNEEDSNDGSGVAPVDNDGTLTVQQSEASRWNSGACFDVIVTNVSAIDQTWQIQLPFEGTINNMWNAEVIGTQGTTATVIGLSWNALLGPQSSASFGYCVQF